MKAVGWVLRGYLMGLGTLLSFQSKAQTPSSVWSVRGAPLEFPLKLRVLVKELGPRDVLNLNGLRIRRADWPTQAFQGVECAFGQSWVCKAEASISKQHRKEAHWRVESGRRIGLMDLGGLAIAVRGVGRFRGSLELLVNPKDPQRLWVINLVELDDYLAALVNKEIHSSYPEHAVRAQVIAARSYAVAVTADRRSKGFSYDLLNTEADQVYHGADFEDSRARALTMATRGQVLWHQGEILKSYYHASSGGHTELPQNVWGDSPRDESAYRAAPSVWDQNRIRWEVVLSPAVGARWPELGRLRSMRIVSVTEGRRVRSLELVGEKKTKFVSGGEFRTLLGSSWIKSTQFEILSHPKGWLLKGVGFGHGVGMSQNGARSMAQAGKNYVQILSHYYPYAQVAEMPIIGSMPQLSAALPPDSSEVKVR